MLKNKWMNTKGNTMLVVVIIMSLLFMMSSIVFGYVIREYRYDKEKEKMMIGELQAVTALSDSIEEIISRLDEGKDIGVFTLSRSNINGDSAINYQAFVFENGEYNSDDYKVTTNKKVYYFDGIFSGNDDDNNENGNNDDSENDNNGVVKTEDYDDFTLGARLDDKNKGIITQYQRGTIIKYEGNLYEVIQTYVYRYNFFRFLSEVPSADTTHWAPYDDGSTVSIESIALTVTTDNDGHPFEEKYIININSDENTDYYTVEVYKAY